VIRNLFVTAVWPDELHCVIGRNQRTLFQQAVPRIRLFPFSLRSSVKIETAVLFFTETRSLCSSFKTSNGEQSNCNPATLFLQCWDTRVWLYLRLTVSMSSEQ